MEVAPCCAGIALLLVAPVWIVNYRNKKLDILSQPTKQSTCRETSQRFAVTTGLCNQFDIRKERFVDEIKKEVFSTILFILGKSWWIIEGRVDKTCANFVDCVASNDRIIQQTELAYL